MITLQEYEKMSKEQRKEYFLSITNEEEQELLKNMDSFDRMLYYRMKEGLNPNIIKKNMRSDYERTITPPIKYLWK